MIKEIQEISYGNRTILALIWLNSFIFGPLPGLGNFKAGALVVVSLEQSINRQGLNLSFGIAPKAKLAKSNPTTMSLMV